MEISLSDPKEGYYVNQKPLGKAGDFITAPDITQIFGEVIGAWSVDIINKIKSKSLFQIIDLGGGRGTLLKDIKRVIKNDNISFGFNCAKQPVITINALGEFFLAFLIILLHSLLAFSVTEHVFITKTSAPSLNSAFENPKSVNCLDIVDVSEKFNLHPNV